MAAALLKRHLAGISLLRALLGVENGCKRDVGALAGVQNAAGATDRRDFLRVDQPESETLIHIDYSEGCSLLL